MRRVATAINESQSKLLDRKLQQIGMSEYELLKTLLESFLETGTIDKAKAKILVKAAMQEAFEILDNAP